MNNMSFFFKSTTPTDIFTLSLHDALPILEAVHFLQPFLPPEVEKKQVKQVKRLIAQTGARLHLVRLDEDYLRILESPKHGYGRAFNPCLDCHIHFLRRAGKMLY